MLKETMQLAFTCALYLHGLGTGMIYHLLHIQCHQMMSVLVESREWSQHILHASL